VVCVHPSVPAKSLRELIELARTRPLAYASPGIGTTPHLSMERINSAAKITLTHVPYQPASAVTAVVAGQTEALSLSLSLTLSQLKAGKLRALAVTSARRAAVLPDVPTVNEQGLEGFDDLNWFGFFAPAGVRAEIVARLHGEIARALDAPEVRKKLYELGLDSSPNTPAEFAAFVRSEVAKWTLAVKDSGAKAE